MLAVHDAIGATIRFAGHDGDGPASRSCSRGAGGGVITSYSIHYTKLYDQPSERLPLGEAPGIQGTDAALAFQLLHQLPQVRGDDAPEVGVILDDEVV